MALWHSAAPGGLKVSHCYTDSKSVLKKQVFPHQFKASQRPRLKEQGLETEPVRRNTGTDWNAQKRTKTEVKQNIYTGFAVY